jgi:hypothetical protein
MQCDRTTIKTQKKCTACKPGLMGAQCQEEIFCERPEEWSGCAVVESSIRMKLWFNGTLFGDKFDAEGNPLFKFGTKIPLLDRSTNAHGHYVVGDGHGRILRCDTLRVPLPGHDHRDVGDFVCDPCYEKTKSSSGTPMEIKCGSDHKLDRANVGCVPRDCGQGRCNSTLNTCDCDAGMTGVRCDHEERGVACIAPDAPIHGNVSGGGGSYPGMIAAFSCNSGYHLVGPSTVSCGTGGNYAGVPTCEPCAGVLHCTDVRCSNQYDQHCASKSACEAGYQRDNMCEGA